MRRFASNGQGSDLLPPHRHAVLRNALAVRTGLPGLPAPRLEFARTFPFPSHARLPSERKDLLEPQNDRGREPIDKAGGVRNDKPEPVDHVVCSEIFDVRDVRPLRLHRTSLCSVVLSSLYAECHLRQ